MHDSFASRNDNDKSWIGKTMRAWQRYSRRFAQSILSVQMRKCYLMNDEHCRSNVIGCSLTCLMFIASKSFEQFGQNFTRNYCTWIHKLKANGKRFTNFRRVFIRIPKKTIICPASNCPICSILFRKKSTEINCLRICNSKCLTVREHLPSSWRIYKSFAATVTNTGANIVFIRCRNVDNQSTGHPIRLKFCTRRVSGCQGIIQLISASWIGIANGPNLHFPRKFILSVRQTHLCLSALLHGTYETKKYSAKFIFDDSELISMTFPESHHPQWLSRRRKLYSRNEILMQNA